MGAIRSFVAIELDAGIKKELRSLQEKLISQAPANQVRWVRSEGIHLTLKFLDDVPETQIPSIENGLKRAAHGISPFVFSVGDLGCFPDRRRPSVIWVGVSDPSGVLFHLQKAVEAQLSLLGYPPEDRPFSAHLTLGRVDRSANLVQRRQIGEIIHATAVGQLGIVRVTGISLMRSDLQPGGSVYTRQFWASLGPVQSSEGARPGHSSSP